MHILVQILLLKKFSKGSHTTTMEAIPTHGQRQALVNSYILRANIKFSMEAAGPTAFIVALHPSRIGFSAISSLHIQLKFYQKAYMVSYNTFRFLPKL